MPIAGWTLDLARQWVSPPRTRWRRRGLAAATVAAFAVSVLGEADSRCSASDPSVCGPDLTFSLAVVLAVASVALLWWRPVVAASCAVAFAALDLAYDDVWTANVAWPVVAALQVAHVVTLHREGLAQRALAARVTVPLPAAASPAPDPRRAAARPFGAPHVAALVLAALALGCLGMLLRAEASDRAHLARSEVVHGTVAEVGDDGTVTVRLDRGPAAGAERFGLEPLDPYDVGDDVLVRVDPTDPGWSHLVAEPPDRTWWASLSAAAALLSLLVTERLVTARVRRAAFLAHPPTHGVPVRFVVDEADTALLVCTDRDAVFADLVVAQRPGAQRVGGDDVLRDSLAHAHLVGDVRHGGWCALATHDGLELPEGPLRPLHELPRTEELDDEDDRDPREWSQPVPADAVPARLPVHLAPSVAERVLWAGVALAAVAFAVWLLEPGERGWFDGLFVVLFAAETTYWAVGRATGAVTIDRSGLTLSSAVRRLHLPMSRVEEVRCTGTHVVVTWGDDDTVEVGPFGDRSAGRHRFDPRPPGPVGAPTAPEVAAAIDDARVAAGSVDAPGTSHAARAPWAGLGPGVPWLALAALVVGARYLAAFVL